MTNQTLAVNQTPIDVAPTGGGFQVDQVAYFFFCTW